MAMTAQTYHDQITALMTKASTLQDTLDEEAKLQSRLKLNAAPQGQVTQPNNTQPTSQAPKNDANEASQIADSFGLDDVLNGRTEPQQSASVSESNAAPKSAAPSAQPQSAQSTEDLSKLVDGMSVDDILNQDNELNI